HGRFRLCGDSGIEHGGMPPGGLPVADAGEAQGRQVIHVDPRFTRTSAVADIHAPIRAGSDVAFLGGLIHHVLESERWNTDPFFKEFVVSYTNAATVVGDDFEGTEELDGVFSGLMEYQPRI